MIHNFTETTFWCKFVSLAKLGIQKNAICISVPIYLFLLQFPTKLDCWHYNLNKVQIRQFLLAIPLETLHFPDYFNPAGWQIRHASFIGKLLTLDHNRGTWGHLAFDNEELSKVNTLSITVLFLRLKIVSENFIKMCTICAQLGHAN